MFGVSSSGTGVGSLPCFPSAPGRSSDPSFQGPATSVPRTARFCTCNEATRAELTWPWHVGVGSVSGTLHSWSDQGLVSGGGTGFSV